MYRFVSTSTDKVLKRYLDHKRIVLEYLTREGSASTVTVMWDLRDKINPLKSFMMMSNFLSRLEREGSVMFKDGKYEVKDE